MKLILRNTAIILFFFSCRWINAGVIDSLESILGQKQGREKIDILNRLAEEYRNIKPDKTSELAEQALELSRKVNYPEGEADAYHKKGIYYYFTDEYDKALSMYNKSLALSEKITNKQLIAQALSWIGSLHRVQGNHKEALENYNAALVLAKEINDKARIVYCLRSIGDDYRMQQENTLALNFFNEASTIAEEINDLDQQAYILTTSGEVYRMQSDFVTAIKTLNEAIAISFKTKNYNLLSNNLFAIGEIYLAKHDYAKALEFYNKSLSTARQIKDKTRIADCYASMGDVYRLEKDLDKAFEYYNASLATAKEINSPNIVAYCYMVMADVFQRKGQGEFAIEYLKMSKDIAEEIGDKHRLSDLYSQLGDLYERKFDYARAEENYLISFEIAKEIGNQSTIASIYVNLGEIALARKDYKKAIDDAERGLKLAKEIDMIQSIVDGTTVLHKAYRHTGKFEKALEMLELSKSISDTLKARENSKLIFEQQIKFEYEEQKAKEKILQARKDAEQQAEIKTQRFIIFFSALALLMVIGLAVVIFISNRKQRAANTLLAKQNRLIEDQKQEITDSINYAQRIQTAIMPDREDFYAVFPNSFILYEPKDIVSGDFYYFQQQMNKDGRKGNYVVAVADCTGHGVPGAFMSMISYQKLEEAVSELFEPRNILKRLNKRIKTALKQHHEDTVSRDGLDIALLSAPKPGPEGGLKARFSAANRPLWIFRKRESGYELEELKVTKTSIAGFTEYSQEFIQHDIELNKGDSLYMFSDGFADQFGGPGNKKMTTRKFKNLLMEIQAYSMRDQQRKLQQFFHEWKGSNTQIDDILVVGIRA